MRNNIPSGWSFLPLASCVSAILDYRGRSPNKVDNGVPLVTAKDIKDGQILPPSEFVGLEDYELWMRRGLPEPGDVLLTTEAPLGEVAQLEDGRVALAQRIVALRGKPGVVDSTYLRFALCSRLVQEQLTARATGTTVQGIRQSELRKILIPVPPVREQLQIARMLSVLIARIDLNRRMNQTLEAIARAIFKSWFVDFDPVREGQAWCSSEGMVGDLGVVLKDALTPAEFPDEGFDHYSLPAFDEGRSPKLERGEEIRSNKLLVPPGVVLLSKLNPRIPRVWLPAVSGGRRSICSTEFLVVAPRNLADREYLFSLFSSDAFAEAFASRVTGTSGSHQRVRIEDFLKMEYAIPEEVARLRFSDAVRPLFDRVGQNIQESKILAALRDTLLPKLLSGEIRVKQAEKVVGESV